MSKINFNYINSRIKLGVGMTLMTCSLVACTPNNSAEKNNYGVVSEIEDAIQLPTSYSFASKNLNFSEKGLNEIERKSGSNKIVIDVIDERDYLSGMELVVRDSTGYPIDKFKTTNEGHILTNVVPGETYLLEEVSVPDNYEKEEKSYKFTIPVVDDEEYPEDKYYITNTLTIYKPSKNYEENNELGSLIISSAERGEGYISGVTFEISDMENKVIETFTSTERAHFVPNLADGDYKIRIIGMPEGYEIEIIDCLIDEEGNEKTLSSNECIITIKDGVYGSKYHAGPIFYITKQETKTLTKTR